MPKAEDKKMDKSADKKMGEKKMSSKSASGAVKSASADSVVVAGKEKGKDAEWTFAVDPKTKVKKGGKDRSEEHTSELQSPCNLVCRLLLEKKKEHESVQLRTA